MEIKPRQPKLKFSGCCQNKRCSEYAVAKENTFSICQQCRQPMLSYADALKKAVIKHAEKVNDEVEKFIEQQKPLNKEKEMAQEQVQIMVNGEEVLPAINQRPIEKEIEMAEVIPENVQRLPGAYEKLQDISIDNFNIDNALKEVISDFVSNRGEVVDQHLKDIVNNAVKILKPTLIKVHEQVSVVIEGRLHKEFEKCLFLCTQERQLFIAGPAGSGKTTLAHQIAKSMQLPFAHISCSAGLSEAHLLGRMLFDGTYVGSDLVKCYEEGGVFLFDEIDAADANTLLTINSALANGVLSVPNRKEKNHAVRHPNFICICAGNTWGNGSFEYHGRNHLDAAFMDRFALSKVLVDYDNDLEKELCGEHLELFNQLNQIRANIVKHKVRRVLSTRAYISGTRQLMAKRSIKNILDTFFIGWSNEEKSKALQN